MSDSSSRPGRKADIYQALIKVGDAVETPDGELWVVLDAGFGKRPVVSLTSAFRGGGGRIYADSYDAATTSVPRELVTKVADARRVRR